MGVTNNRVATAEAADKSVREAGEDGSAATKVRVGGDAEEAEAAEEEEEGYGTRPGARPALALTAAGAAVACRK